MLFYTTPRALLGPVVRSVRVVEERRVGGLLTAAIAANEKKGLLSTVVAAAAATGMRSSPLVASARALLASLVEVEIVVALNDAAAKNNRGALAALLAEVHLAGPMPRLCGRRAACHTAGTQAAEANPHPAVVGQVRGKSACEPERTAALNITCLPGAQGARWAHRAARPGSHLELRGSYELALCP